MIDTALRKLNKTEKKLREYRMLIFVRNDLGMNKGKIAAQVGHACWRIASNVAMDLWTQTMSYSQREEKHAVMMGNIEYEYEEAGEKKFIFKVNELPTVMKLFGAVLYQDDTIHINDEWFTLVKDTNIDDFTCFAALVHRPVDTKEWQLL